jgi:hypothetical protein
MSKPGIKSRILFPAAFLLLILFLLYLVIDTI